MQHVELYAFYNPPSPLSSNYGLFPIQDHSVDTNGASAAMSNYCLLKALCTSSCNDFHAVSTHFRGPTRS